MTRAPTTAPGNVDFQASVATSAPPFGIAST
jgi:hypothetical protein